MSSAFSEILAEMLAAMPGAKGAIFVDWEGEEVDEACESGTYDMRLIGAQWSIAFQQARTAFTHLEMGTADEMVLRFERLQILARRVTDEYVVLLAIGREENLGRARYLLREAGQRLKGEM